MTNESNRAHEQISNSNLAVAFILGALLLSGFASLGYEIVWQRLLVRLMGATLPSVTLIFCIFMAGLASGSLLSIVLLKRVKNALILYAWLEAGIGSIGVIMPVLFEQNFVDVFLLRATRTIAANILSLTGFAANHHGGHFVRLLASLPFEFVDLSYGLLVFILLSGMFIATVMMGATFNCVTKLLAQNSWLLKSWFGLDAFGPTTDSTLGRKLMYCYCINLVGAALGSVVTAFVYIPAIGLVGTSSIMAVLNLAVAISMFRTNFDKRWHFSADAESPGGEEIDAGAETDELVVESEAEAISAGAAVPLAFCFSFVGMAMEVVWTRVLCLVLGSSTYAIGGVLCLNLLGLSVGAFFAPRLIRRRLPPLSVVSGAALATAAYLAVSLFLIPRSVWLFLCLQKYLLDVHASLYVISFASRLLICALLVLPPTALLGLIFPCLIGTKVQPGKAVGTIGRLLAGSTLGSISGALSANLIIPNSTWVSGIEFCFIAITCLLLGLALVADVFVPKDDAIRSQARLLFLGLCAIPLMVLVLRPPWNTTIMSTGASFLEIPAAKLRSFSVFAAAIEASSSPPLLYHEGLSSTVTVETNPGRNVIFLKSNGKVEASLPIDWQKPAPTSDERTQVLLGALPVLNCNADKMDAFLIGLGSGTTAGTILGCDRVKRLKICELEPSVVAASHFFDGVNGQPLRNEWLASKRVQVDLSDGRASLTRNPDCYDIIVSQPSEPWVSGSSDLFTTEFWQLAKNRLKPFGVFCQWLQLYCIDQETLTNLLATFADVFPATYVYQPEGSGEIILIGYGVPPAVDVFGHKATLAERVRQAKLGEALARAGLPDTEALRGQLLLSPPQVRSLVSSVDHRQYNHDASLQTEYRLPAELLFSQKNLLDNLRFLHQNKAVQN